MAQYLNQFQKLANQLRGLSVKGKGMDDSQLVTILTLSLPGSYEPLVMALQSRSDTITFDMMAERLLQESGWRQISHATQTHDETNLPPHTAFSVQLGSTGGTQNRGRGAFGNYSRGRGESRNKGQGSVNQNTVGKDTSQAIRGVAPGTKCHYCSKSGHWKRDCYKRKADEAAGGGTAHAREFTFLADSTKSRAGDGWIIDSGASQHRSLNRTQFCTHGSVSGPQLITIEDGSTIEAEGIGNVEIVTEAGVIVLTRVWHVPSIGTGLISVTRMVDAGYHVEFEGTTCYVSRHGMRKQLGSGKGSLYRLSVRTAFAGWNCSKDRSRNEAHLGLMTN